MSAVEIATGITIDEFEQLPQALAKHRELINGELVDVSGNTAFHNALRDWLVTMLMPLVKAQHLGRIISEQEFDFEGNAHGPDVALISAANVASIDPKRRVQRFVPAFAIEIVSSNDKFNAVMEKAARYRRCGTREVWVLSPENRQAFIQSEDRRLILNEEDVLETKLIPGFSVKVGELYDLAL